MSAHTLFQDLAPDRLAEALAAFGEEQVPPGTRLIAEFDTTDFVLLLEAGEVNVSVGGARVATLEPGAVLGEIGLFTQAVRTATVTTTGPAVVRRLTRAAFDALRDAGNPVASRVERRTLAQLQSRLDQPIASLQAVALGAPVLRVPLLPEPAPGTVAPLSSTALGAVLGTATTFSALNHRHLRRMVPGATLRVFGRDDIITDPDDHPTLHVLVEGAVHAFAPLPASTRHQERVRVAHVGHGQIFGLSRRLGSDPLAYVAQDACSVLSFDGSLATELMEGDSAHASSLRHAAIASLFARLTSANDLLKDASRLLSTAAPAPHRDSLARDEPVQDVVFDPWFG